MKQPADVANPEAPVEKPARDPVADHAKGEALFARLDSADPVVEIPSDVVNMEVLGLLVISTRRIVIPVPGKGGPLRRLAVRPKAGCKVCNGSPAYRAHVPVQGNPGATKQATRDEPCGCIDKQIEKWLPPAAPRVVVPPHDALARRTPR